MSAEAFSVCVGQARDRATAAVVEASYRSGRLGGAAVVRSQIAAIGSTRGFDKKSFLGENGSILPRRSMNDDQWETFQTWAADAESSHAALGREAFAAGQRAAERARSSCAN